MIIYLTYNEQPSGIFSSQVVDVVRFVQDELRTSIKLVAFISLRGYFSNRKKIKSEWPKTMVLPMVPGIKRWRMNRSLLQWIIRRNLPSTVICRSVLATNLAMLTNAKKIVYDGRGAIAEEWNEYNVVNDPNLISQISDLEKNAVLNSHFRIAVSNKLVEHWNEKFGYSKNEHVVIPCTLNKEFEQFTIDKDNISRTRESLGIESYETAFVYSGSLAGWQSFELLHDFLKKVLLEKDRKMIFFADADPVIEKLEKEFGTKIIRRKLSPREMPGFLAAADHALLIREKSVTNSVASPVKFAEYLRCGLNIIMSQHIGDYSAMLVHNGWGQLNTDTDLRLKRPSLDEKINVSLKAKELFSKRNYINEYKKAIS
jgi:hypothetical protein